MAKIELDIKLNPQINKSEYQQQLRKLEADVSDIDIGIHIDSSKAENAMSEVMDIYSELEEAMNEVLSVDINTQEGQAALDRLNKTINEIESADFNVDKLASEFSRTKSEVEQLLNTQKQALAQMKLTGREGSDAYEKLQSEIDQTEAKLKEMQDAMEDISNIDEPEGFMNFFAKFEALANLGESLSGFAESGIEMQKAMREVQAATGATAQEMEHLESAAVSAFRAGVGESLADALKTIGYAKNILGDFLDDKQINDFVQSAQGIANVFDKDINEVIAGSRTFIANYGLEGKQAADLIALAMQEGGSKMDDVLDTLDEYSQLAEAAGLSAEKFVGIIKVGMSEGTRDTDKLLDSLKEAQIRLNAGDTSKALSGITDPIAQQIQAIVKLGETGQKSVADVVNESAKMIKEAYDAGEITAAVRDQLTTALGGTMAEDIGGTMWANIFGADIDENAIRQQAESAGKLINEAIGPVTFADKLKKEFEIFSATISQTFAGSAQSIGSFMTTLGQIAPGLALLQQNFSNITTLGSKAFGSLKSLVVTAFASIKTAFTTGTVSATAFWSAATLGAALLIPLLIELYNNFEPFKELIDDMASWFIDGFNTIYSYVSGFVSNFGEILSAIGDLASAYLNPVNWFSDEGDQLRQKAKEKLTKALTGAIDDAENDIKKRGLGETLEQSIQLKGEIDKNNQLKKFIEQYKNAKTEADKNSLAKAIQEQVPGALDGIQTVVDANGEIKEVYSVNIQKAEEFANAQEKAFSGDLQARQEAFKEGIKALANEYDNTKTRIQQIQQQIVENSKAGLDTTELRKEYDQLLEDLKQQGEELNKTFEQGVSLGLLKEDAQQFASELGLSKSTTKEIESNIKNVKKGIDSATKSAGSLGDAFLEAKKSSDEMVQNTTNELAGLILARKKGTISQEEYNQKYKELLSSYRQSRKEQELIDRTLKSIEGKYKTIDDYAAQREKSLETRLKELETEKEIADIDREIAIIKRGTGETIYDEINAQEAQVKLLKDKLQVLNETKALTAEQRQNIRQQIADISDELKKEEKNLEKLTIQAQVDMKQLRQELENAKKEYEKSKIEFDIQLGIADGSALIEFYEKILDEIKAKKDEINAKLLTTNNEAERIALEQQLTELSNKELETRRNIIQEEDKMIEEQYQRQASMLDRQLEEEQDKWEQYYENFRQITDSWLDTADSLLRASTDSRLDRLDKQHQAELDMFVGTEEQKKALIEKYEKEKAAIIEEAEARRLAYQQSSAGQQIAIENARDIKEAEARKKQLELELEYEMQKQERDEAKIRQLQADLEKTEKIILDKGDNLRQAWDIVGEGLSDVIGNMFQGDIEGMKEGMKGILSTIVGFVTKLLALKVWAIVSESTWWTSLAALAPPGSEAAVIAAGQALISGMIDAIAKPFLNEIASFSTGGIFEEPQLAIVGDAARLGGENTEILLRSDQLQKVIDIGLQKNNSIMANYFGQMLDVLSNQRIVGELRGDKLLLLMERAKAANNRRNVL